MQIKRNPARAVPVASACPNQNPKRKPKGHGQPWKPKPLANALANRRTFEGKVTPPAEISVLASVGGYMGETVDLASSR